MASSIVNPRLIGVLRTVDEAMMPDTFAVLRDTAVVDTGGGRSTTETTVAVAACRVRALKGATEQALADRLAWTMPYAVDLPATTSVTPSDRLRINGARTFQIGGVIDIGAWATTLVAVCQEVG